jgi:hypothetical protein
MMVRAATMMETTTAAMGSLAAKVSKPRATRTTKPRIAMTTMTTMMRMNSRWKKSSARALQSSPAISDLAIAPA